MAKGINCLGIEPCESVALAARKKNIETRVEFFGRQYADVLRDEGWTADLITANNVLAHVPDINDFVGGVKMLLAPNGVATFEVQHLLTLMQRHQFDTIYHEHFSYLSLIAGQRIFAKAGLRVFDVELPRDARRIDPVLCLPRAGLPPGKSAGGGGSGARNGPTVSTATPSTSPGTSR